MYGIAADSNLK